MTIDPEADATIFYTSGTTGRPKGALGTHRNICTNLMSLGYAQARAAARATEPTLAANAAARTSDQNAYLLSVPFFHATGCHSVLVANLFFGGKIVIMYKWDAGRALELIERESITTFGGVPAMVWQVLDHPDFATRDISSVRSIGYGGAPAAPELVRRIEEMFPGRTPSNGYGLTETSSVTTMNSGADYLRKPGSVGLPVPVCDVQVVDADGAPVPAGEVGELWIKGPNVVKGYFNKPDATAASFTDGWLHSGDVARLDDEGFVYIVDRAKDMIIRGGENVYCVEVEAALYEHPAGERRRGDRHPAPGAGGGGRRGRLRPARHTRHRGRAAGPRGRAAGRVQGARADLVPRRAAPPQPGGQDPQARPQGRAARGVTTGPTPELVDVVDLDDVVIATVARAQRAGREPPPPGRVRARALLAR